MPHFKLGVKEAWAPGSQGGQAATREQQRANGQAKAADLLVASPTWNLELSCEQHLAWGRGAHNITHVVHRQDHSRREGERERHVLSHGAEAYDSFYRLLVNCAAICLSSARPGLTSTYRQGKGVRPSLLSMPQPNQGSPWGTGKAGAYAPAC